jgi:hypothetical protein
MNQFIRPVQITTEAHLIQSFWKVPGAPVGAHINTMVLASREPVVFDTGVAADRDGWLAAVSSVVDPDDVRWIVLRRALARRMRTSLRSFSFARLWRWATAPVNFCV